MFRPHIATIFRGVFLNLHICICPPISWGPGELSRYCDWLQARRSGDRIAMWARFSALVQTGPEAHPPIQWVPGISRGKAAGAWRWPPTKSSAEVKERVELYVYSTSGPSLFVIGWILLFYPLSANCLYFSAVSRCIMCYICLSTTPLW